MKKYISLLRDTQLFKGVAEGELEAMLDCLGARLYHYKRGEYVLRAGEKKHPLMILAEGKLHIQREDYWGNRAILHNVEPGEMLGEAFAPSEGEGLINDVVAVEDSVTIAFDINRILTVCPSACPFHALTVKNLFLAVANKNRQLVAKLGYISHRSTRDKLLAYLSDRAVHRGKPDFYIPFNRQQLADYLSVDRSAMSRELCKMRDEGLIEFNKNHFVLL